MNRSASFIHGILLSGALSACATTGTALQEGRSELASGNEAVAEQHFRTALKDDSDADEASRELEAILVGRGRDLKDVDPAEAKASYEEALKIRPDSDQARIGLARLLADNHEFAEALETLALKTCRPCRRIIAVVHNESGRAKMVAEDWDGAMEDFRKSLTQGDDPHVLLEITEIYTVGHHGRGLEAAGRLDTSLPLIRSEMIGLQELWASQRRLIVLEAAKHNDVDAIAAASQLADPRAGLNAEEKFLAWAELQYEAAVVQIQHAHYDQGVQRGLAMLAHAKAKLTEAHFDQMRERVLGLYTIRAAHLLGNGNGAAAMIGIEEGLKLDPEHVILRYQQVLAAGTRKVKDARALLDAIGTDTPHWKRIAATVRGMVAQAHLDAGRFTGAMQAIERAAAMDPDLLEVHLIRAEWLGASRITDLKKRHLEAFAASGKFEYPGGRINRYGQALAEINYMRSKLEEHEEEQHHPLRAPSFMARLGSLEALVRSFYPWETRLVPEPDPRILFINEGSSEESVTIAGPGVRSTVVVKPGEPTPVVFSQPGFTTLSIGGETALFVEEFTTIEIKL